jgi:two-component system OmpR family response regulator
VDSRVNRLRKKIEDDPANPRYVLTVYKVGYRFREEE